MRKGIAWLGSISVLTGAAFAALAALPCAFTGADAGSPLAFESVSLPPVDLTPGPGIPLAPRPSPWAPPTSQLLQGEVIIRNAGEMKDVWKRLFNVPYDASLFDFDTSFVVLMGAGVLPSGATFDIDCVERAIGHYDDPTSLRGGDEPFLSIAATTFLSGVQPIDPPPPSYRVSAIKLDKSLFDDVVFHRRIVMGV